MSISLKQENSTPELDRIFSIYIAAGIRPNTSYKAIREIAKSTEGTLTDREKEFLRSGNFRLGMDSFQISPDENIDRFDLYAGFNNFIKTLFGIVANRKPEFEDMKGVVRKKLPELKSFEYTGNNDMKISYQPADYTLIYG